MKKQITLMVVFAVLGAVVQAQDAAEIVRASRDRIKANTTSTRSRMTISAKDGSVSERVIDQYSKDGPKGKRTVIVFQQPRSVAGSRFLTMENPGKEDDRWIFLPGLGKVRRIAGAEGSSSFMGSDFSYDDISSAGRNAALDTHTLLREENLNGAACYVIQSVPKDSGYQYAKMIQWINKQTLMALKLDLYDKQGGLIKTAEFSGIRDIQGRLTATITKMTTLGAGTFTAITMDIVKYDDPIPDGVFTTAYLETGRPQ
jgi:outer membrane lipoprotein-sorting protein